jgi:hypothetical protein
MALPKFYYSLSIRVVGLDLYEIKFTIGTLYLLLGGLVRKKTYAYAYAYAYSYFLGGAYAENSIPKVCVAIYIDS